MGNDGGSIPGRRELVKEKKQEKPVNWRSIARARALYCALSKEHFRKPIVICRLGNIFNKAAVVSALVEKKMPKCFSHIKSLKNVKEAKVILKSDITGKTTGEAPIICPITQIECDGIHKFCMIWSCGCVISERALKELNKGKITKCINCNKLCSQSDIINLNPTKEEQEKSRASLMNKEENKKASEEENTKKPFTLAGVRRNPEESKAPKDSKIILKKIKEDIISSAKPDALKVILSGKPAQPEQDDFMTRCAHRGLH